MIIFPSGLADSQSLNPLIGLFVARMRARRHGGEGSDDRELAEDETYKPEALGTGRSAGALPETRLGVPSVTCHLLVP